MRYEYADKLYFYVNNLSEKKTFFTYLKFKEIVT